MSTINVRTSFHAWFLNGRSRLAVLESAVGQLPGNVSFLVDILTSSSLHSRRGLMCEAEAYVVSEKNCPTCESGPGSITCGQPRLAALCSGVDRPVSRGPVSRGPMSRGPLLNVGQSAGGILEIQFYSLNLTVAWLAE